MKVLGYLFSVSLVVFLFLLSGCKDPADPKPPASKTVDLYVGGKYFDVTVDGGTWVPAYWKNGELIKLSMEAGNVSIITTDETGSDVYALAEYPEKAYLWINGIQKNLPSTYNRDVVVRGSDYYISGRINGPDYKNQISIWKNEEIIRDLGSILGGSFVYDLEINADKIYAAGYDNSGIGHEAAYWQNGDKHVLNHDIGVKYGSIHAFKVIGNDQYAVGINGRLGVWMNNVFSPLGDEWAQVYSNNCLAIAGGDIYVCGSVYQEEAELPDMKHAVYWKNGEIVILDSSTSNSKAISIFVNNNDVYILGDIDGSAVLWKNGEVVQPFDGDANISGSCLFLIEY